MKRLIILLMSACCVAAIFAHDLLDDLVSRGNRAYENADRRRILQCADSIRDILQSGEITNPDELDDYTASMLKLYGNYHYENGADNQASFRLAEQYYDRVDSLMQANPNTTFTGPMRLLLPREKAQLFYRLEKYPEAVASLRQADDFIEYSGVYEPGSDQWLMTKMTLALSLARAGEFDEALEIAENEMRQAADRKSLDYARAQRMHAKILLLAGAKRDGALAAYKSYFLKQRNEALNELAGMSASERELYWLRLRPFITDCYRLEDADPAFLYDVTLFAKGLLLQFAADPANKQAHADAVKALRTSWSDVRKALKKGEAAVEFIEYEKDGRQCMAALVLKSGERPRFIAITSADEILSYVKAPMESTARGNKDRIYNSKNVRDLVWTQPLLDALADASTVYFAPEGYMHRFAIEYLEPVSDKQMYRLSSTRRLAIRDRGRKKEGMLLVGGVDYNAPHTEPAEEGNDADALRSYLGMSFTPLSETIVEVQTISGIRNNPADTIISGANASEELFRHLAPDYGTILVSTHGDFNTRPLPAPNDLKEAEPDNGMSRSIIALAGVNTSLNVSSGASPASFDGLLSAKEIATLDLSGCGLVTLSACQTALGKMTADGVFGIQRALKQAGARTMLLSLWNVSSEATLQLMISFFTHLGEGLSTHDAFNRARRDLMTGGASGGFIFDAGVMATVPADNNPRFSAPQFSNAFILIDPI